MSQSNSSLVQTLNLALSQCQEQLKLIQGYSSRIDQLQQDNKRLTKELQNLRDTTIKSAQDGSEQTQDLFQRNAEAQAEIRNLKSKLRSYKRRASKTLLAVPSSPTSTPVTPLPSSPKSSSGKRKISDVLQTSSSPSRVCGAAKQNREKDIFEQAPDMISPSPPRKRARPNASGTKPILQEVPANLIREKPPFPNISTNAIPEQTYAAVYQIAEDGDEEARVGNNPNTPTVHKDNPIHYRLDDLLAGSTPEKNRLTRPTSRGLHSAGSHRVSTTRKTTSISNVWHTVSETQKLSKGSPRTSDIGTDLQNEENEVESEIPQSSSSCRKSPPTIGHSANLIRATEPLRTQPLADLMLSSFRPNPRWLSSHNISFDDFLNDRQHERMRILATTLPHLPGETHDRHFTDHELLLEILGPGSESRIAGLTPVARENLVIEARTKRVSSKFRLSKQTAPFDDEDAPLGFWSTDMPGTQEAEENKAASRQKEREEVKRRFDDALSGQGRWIFADE